MVFTSVDLPWPLAPRMPMRWPASTERVDLAATMGGGVPAAASAAVAAARPSQASIGLGRLAARGTRSRSRHGQHRRQRSMRSSALTRLCAWRALVALALKRSMKRCRCAIVSCCFEVGGLLQRQISARISSKAL
jgi:hypothetical protein